MLYQAVMKILSRLVKIKILVIVGLVHHCVELSLIIFRPGNPVQQNAGLKGALYL
jgi:hypothetical protein